MRCNSHNSRKGTNGKVIGSKHNDRDFNLDSQYASHIDKTKSGNNLYIYYQEIEEKNVKEMTFDEYEEQVYKKNFCEFLAVKNCKAKDCRHPDRMQTMEQLRQAFKTCPEESIFTVGNMNEQIPADTLISIFDKFIEWHKATFPNCMLLDAAVHVDEANPHIHWRKIWTAHEGKMLIINQNKALAEMGVDVPFPDKEKGRYNNAKITYTNQCHAKQIELARSYGYEIEVEPKQKSQQGKTLLQVKCDTLEKQIAEKDSEIERLQGQVLTLSQRVEDLTEQANELTLDDKKGLLETKGNYKERQQLHTKSKLVEQREKNVEIREKSVEWDEQAVKAKEKALKAAERQAEDALTRKETALNERERNLDKEVEEKVTKRIEGIFDGLTTDREYRLRDYCDTIKFKDGTSVLDRFEEQEQALREEITIKRSQGREMSR